MPSFTQAGLSSTSTSEHQWTSKQTYNLLDHILSNPKYTQNFFPTPGHTPAPGIIKRYARTLCMIVLKDTAWVEGMKEKHEGGRLKFARNDPVTLRLKELPEMAVHYEERLGGYTRYEDLPDGSEYAKRWRKYERCPERQWVLRYFALKRIQADNSIMVDPDSLMDAGPSMSIPAPTNEEHVEGGGPGSAQSKGSGSRKRASLRPDDPHLISKRRRSSMNGQETIKQSSVWSSDPDKEKVIIVISDSEEDDTIPIRSRSSHTKRAPSPTFVDSDSDSDSEDDGIRSVSPPIITLPSRSLGLPPPDSPYKGTAPGPVRLAFQRPIDDTPTDSEDEDINPPSRAGRGIDTFSSISLTTNEDLAGMFTDPNLRPQQAWRNNIPTPPDSRGSGSTSPIKPAGRGWDSALTPQPEVGVRAVSKKDMDIEINLDHDISDGLDAGRPVTPPLPNATPALGVDQVIQDHQNISQTSSERPRTPSNTNLPNDRPITPPLPSHLIEQPIQPQYRAAPDISEIEDIHHEPSDAEREIAARLLRTLTSDQPSQEDITTMPVDQYPLLPAHKETSTNVLADWIASHTGTSLDTADILPAERGRERRPLLDKMAPGICQGKGKGKEVESPRQNPNSQIEEAYIEGTSSPAVDTSETNFTSTIQPGSAGPSATPLMNATSIHKATFQVSSSILDILIAQIHSTSPLYLSGHVIAFAPGHIPFRPKLAELVIALGGIVLEECQVRVSRGRRYIVHPIGEGRGDLGDDLKEVDVLGFLEIVGSKIRGSA